MNDYRRRYSFFTGLGEDYAKQHPELVGAYMQTAAANFAATFQGDRLKEIAGHLEAIFNVVSGVAAKFS